MPVAGTGDRHTLSNWKTHIHLVNFSALNQPTIPMEMHGILFLAVGHAACDIKAAYHAIS